MLIDVGPFRESADFGRLFASQLFTVWCRQVVLVALPLQVYLITGSSLWVGLLGVVQAAAIVVVGLFGGALVDRFERRRIQAIGKTLAAAISLALAVATWSNHTPLFAVLALGALGTAAFMLDQSARAATVPRLVPGHMLSSALSLGMVLTRSGAMIGPAIGGVVIATFGLPWAYAIDVGGFVPAIVLVGMLKPQAVEGGHVSIGLRAPVEALAYVRRTPILISTFLADLNATIFGMPTAVFPALALSVFRIGPTGLGLLYSADGIGAFVATLLSGWVRRVERQGLFIIGAIVVWGLAITAFGITGANRWLGLLFLAIAGAADMISAVFRGTIFQREVPDRLRGRMSAFNSMVVNTGPRLGDLEAGGVATLVSPIFSVISGGVLTVVGMALLAAVSPTLWRYRRPSPPGPEPAPTLDDAASPTSTAAAPNA